MRWGGDGGIVIERVGLGTVVSCFIMPEQKPVPVHPAAEFHWTLL